MDQYFSLLGEVLMEHNLVDKPSQIYNVDESGVTKPPNVITKKDSKKLRYWVSGRKGQVTIIVGCANAIGQAIPPIVIYDARNLNLAWTKREFPGTNYGLSDKGWINTVVWSLVVGGLSVRSFSSSCSCCWNVQHTLSATNSMFS